MSRLVQNALLHHDLLMSESQPEPQTLPFATIDASPPQTSVQVELATKKLRILSLDGGGVRGLFAVIILEALMRKFGFSLNRKTTSDHVISLTLLVAQVRVGF